MLTPMIDILVFISISAIAVVLFAATLTAIVTKKIFTNFNKRKK